MSIIRLQHITTILALTLPLQSLSDETRSDDREDLQIDAFVGLGNDSYAA